MEIKKKEALYLRKKGLDGAVGGLQSSFVVIEWFHSSLSVFVW